MSDKSPKIVQKRQKKEVKKVDGDGGVVVRPHDSQYDEVRGRYYEKLVVCTREELISRGYQLEQKVRTSVALLKRLGYFFNYLSVAGTKPIGTHLNRCCLGDRGLTWLLSDIRLFPFSWSVDDDDDGDGDLEWKEVKEAMQVIRWGGEQAHNLRKELRPLSSDSTTKFPLSLRRPNTTLMNYYLPETKEEQNYDQYFNLGKMIVRWHNDQVLPGSDIYVLHCTPSQSEASSSPVSVDSSTTVVCRRMWTWDVPAISMEVRTGDFYMMLEDFNDKFQHGVLSQTDNHTRVSTTWRLVDESYSTWGYISSKVNKTLSAALGIPFLLSDQQLGIITEDHINNAIQMLLDENTTKIMDSVMTTFVEIEFGWIRPFWLYGERHATMHKHYWSKNIMELEYGWWVMNWMIKDFVLSLAEQKTKLSLVATAKQHLSALQYYRDQYFQIYRRDLFHTFEESHKPLIRPEFEALFDPSFAISLLE